MVRKTRKWLFWIFFQPHKKVRVVSRIPPAHNSLVDLVQRILCSKYYAIKSRLAQILVSGLFPLPYTFLRYWIYQTSKLSKVGNSRDYWRFPKIHRYHITQVMWHNISTFSDPALRNFTGKILPHIDCLWPVKIVSVFSKHDIIQPHLKTFFRAISYAPL